MHAQVEKSKADNSRAVGNSVARKQSGVVPVFQFINNRPALASQDKLQVMANNSPQIKQLRVFQEMANTVPQLPRMRPSLMSEISPLVQKRGIEEDKLLQGEFAPVPKMELEVVQRVNGDGEEEQDLAGAVGDAATAVTTIAGDTGLGAAMESIAELAEGAGGAQEVLAGSEVVPRLTGAARALNTVAGFVGRDVPIVGQVASAVEFTQSMFQKLPAARTEASQARSDLADPDLEMGRTQAEREQRVEAAENARSEVIAEAASQAGSVTGVPLLDKTASLAATAVTQGPAAAAEQARTGATSTAATLYSAAQRSSQLAYDGVAQWLEHREQARDDMAYTDLLDRMERGEL